MDRGPLSRLTWKPGGWRFVTARLRRFKRPGRFRISGAVFRYAGLGLGALLLAALISRVNEIPAANPIFQVAGVDVDLDAVPKLDMTKFGVALDQVVFDTFDGRFVRLPEASERVIRRLRDAIKPIYNPDYGDKGGLSWLRDDDLVIGFTSKSGAYAYPIKPLNFRELVNDEIDGVPILVSYCPLCGSGAVYSRNLEGKTLLFGNTSALYHSDLVMYDHETGSYWFQVGGEAIVGELTGKRLTLLPSTTVSWGEWKRVYPDTRLLVGDDGDGFSRRLALDPFVGYSDSLNQGRFAFPISQDKLDSRLRAGEVVITAEVNSGIKAYPIGLIGENAVNDKVGDQPVVIFSLESAGFAYSAVVDDKPLTFQFKDGKFMDRETESTWDFSGQAVSGPLQGSRLEPLPSRRAFWFSVAGTIPDLRLYLP